MMNMDNTISGTFKKHLAVGGGRVCAIFDTNYYEKYWRVAKLVTVLTIIVSKILSTNSIDIKERPHQMQNWARESSKT